MSERQLPDQQDVAMFRLGFRSALEMCERMARSVPGWQRGRRKLADEFAAILKQQKTVKCFYCDKPVNDPPGVCEECQRKEQ